LDLEMKHNTELRRFIEVRHRSALSF
jgi:hypothetical protein